MYSYIGSIALQHKHFLVISLSHSNLYHANTEIYIVWESITKQYNNNNVSSVITQEGYGKDGEQHYHYLVHKERLLSINTVITTIT